MFVSSNWFNPDSTCLINFNRKFAIRKNSCFIVITLCFDVVRVLLEDLSVFIWTDPVSFDVFRIVKLGTRNSNDSYNKNVHSHIPLDVENANTLDDGCLISRSPDLTYVLVGNIFFV